MSHDAAKPLETDPEGDAFRATRRALNEDLTKLRAEIAAATRELAAFAEQLRNPPDG